MFTATHLHAMIVHFPIALLLVGFLFEITYFISKNDFFHRASFYLLVLAAIGAIVAYITGNVAGEGMEEGRMKRTMDSHEMSATITLCLTVAAALARLIYEFMKKKVQWFRIAIFALFAFAVAGVLRTGYLGGQLVFKHAAGVEMEIGIQE